MAKAKYIKQPSRQHWNRPSTSHTNWTRGSKRTRGWTTPHCQKWTYWCQPNYINKQHNYWQSFRQECLTIQPYSKARQRLWAILLRKTLPLYGSHYLEPQLHLCNHPPRYPHVPQLRRWLGPSASLQHDPNFYEGRNLSMGWQRTECCLQRTLPNSYEGYLWTH